MTLNGGYEWIYISDYLIGYYYRSQLQFLNQDTGYYTGYDGLVGSGRLSTTVDGGNSWNHIVGDFYDIDMYCDTIGYCIKWTGEIFKTTTGGIIVGTFDKSYENESISVFPNPASHFMNIRRLKVESRNLIIIYDMFGRLKDEILVPAGQEESQINIAGYPDGIYLVVLQNEENPIGREKIVVKH